jgi:hypothetical protein
MVQPVKSPVLHTDCKKTVLGFDVTKDIDQPILETVLER